MAEENGGEIGGRLFGWSFKFRGRDAIIILLLSGALGGAFWLQDKRLALGEAEHRDLHNRMNMVFQEMQVQTWLLSLPPDERPTVLPPEHIWTRLPADTYQELEKLRSRRSKATGEKSK